MNLNSISRLIEKFYRSESITDEELDALIEYHATLTDYIWGYGQPETNIARKVIYDNLIRLEKYREARKQSQLRQ